MKLEELKLIKEELFYFYVESQFRGITTPRGEVLKYKLADVGLGHSFTIGSDLGSFVAVPVHP